MALLLGATIGATVGGTTPAAAQSRDPAGGVRTPSIGQPDLWRWSAGVALAAQRAEGQDWATGEVRGSVWRPLGNALTGLSAIQFEAFGGTGTGEPDGGVRARLMIPFARLGVGVDHTFVSPRTRWFASFVRPVRRGGLFSDGSALRLDVGFTGDRFVSLGLEKPFQRRIPPGRARPPRDHVRLSPSRVAAGSEPPRPTVRTALAEANLHAAWIGRFTVPWLDHRSSNAARSESEVLAQIAALRGDLSTVDASGRRTPRLIEDEVRRYHAALVRAFAGALAPVSGAPLTRQEDALAQAVAAEARTILLDEVLLPYDRLLGQAKDEDTTNEFARHARGLFLRWLHVESGVPAEAMDRVLGVFIALLDLVEENRARIHAEWRDSRVVWLPLQYALLPEEHDTQAEIDALIERATNTAFSEGNRLSYVINEQAQYQFSRMIRAAREYHVLWVHDFRGIDDGGDPDEQSYRHVVASYLRAMTERVRAYDATGTFPSYLIFIDEWFYSWRKARLWLTLLEDPMRHTVRLPSDFSQWETELRAAQDTLRAAVAASPLLQKQRIQYGERWLHDLVKVHVSVTNTAEWSFWSRRLAPPLATPDNFLRDHRKISFYDISEEDPYRGEAMFTGAGVGENYSNTTWEDRSLLLQGPAALHLKGAARHLLLEQGLTPDRIPWALRPRERAAGYDARVREAGEGARGMQRAVGVHNATGYARKDVNVTKAILYTLMPPGSVIKVPDSLWNASFWAAALAGCALRGGRVLVIAPSYANSPVTAFGSLQQAYELLWRLTAVSRDLAPELEERGGLLRVGLFSSTLAVTDIGGKLKASQRTFAEHAWLRTLFGFPPSVYEEFAALVAQMGDVLVPETSGDFESEGYPKLHLKANLAASREAWSVMTRPEWVAMTTEFVQQRIAQAQQRRNAVWLLDSIADATLTVGDAPIREWYAALPPAERERVVFYALIGSHNQNARSLVTDGEVALVVSGWPSVIPYLDLVAIVAQSAWPEDPAELAALLPPQSALERWLTHRFRLVF
ncbi:MAG: hypothetical protein KJZ74_03780 [Gemmatimonadales bacterium]|nr:hypothetical protein [Gemmatimonadota bacterium]MCL4213013.1 hypothetical protein [Gemmatimonadales bacterium]